MTRTSFLPSVNGWPFSNYGTFGNCGGMCFTALDYFYGRKAIDRTIPPPPEGSALRKEIESRQKDTMNDWLWAKVLAWTIKPDLGSDGVGHLTEKDEWPDIRSRIDAGEPTTLCLIRVEGIKANPANNHQVVAYGYDLDSSQKHVTIFVYDPNERGNTAKLEFDLGRPDGKINPKDSTGNRLRGFFIVKYDRDINVHIHKMNPNGLVGARVDQRVWTSGWTQAEYFSVGSQLFLFLLKKRNGLVHIHRVNADGSVGERVQKYDWSEGWTSVSFYQIAGRTFLFLLKHENGWVHVHQMNADGSVGTQIAKYDWSAGWTQAVPFRVGIGNYLFLLKEGTGEVHIHSLSNEGQVGKQVVSYDWSSGWTTAVFYVVGDKTYLLLLKKGDGTVHLHLMNSNGTVGTQIDTRDWTSGWAQAVPYQVGAQCYLFLLKRDSGEVHIHQILPNGRIGNEVGRYDWSSGWTTVKIFSVGPSTYLFLLKETQSSEQGWLPDIPFI